MRQIPRPDDRAALRALTLAAAVAACGGAAPAASIPRPNASPTAASAPPTGVVTGAPHPTLPRGLELRGGRPALVNGEAAACIPLCGEGRVAGGKLPEGRYQTEWFFGGYMTLETDGTWVRDEDSNGELSLPVSGSGEDTYRVAFFLDPALVIEDQIQDVPRTAAEYVEWLSARPHLVVSKAVATTIGALPATSVDIRLAATAPRQYEDCPAACVTFLKVAAFDHSDGVLGDDVYRFYLADVSYSGSDHMLVVKVEGRDAGDLRTVLERVEPMLETVVVPARQGHVGD